MGRMSGYFMSISWGPTVGIVLAGACWAWGAGTEDIKEIFHFYPFGYPLCQRFSECGGPTDPEFFMVVDLSSVLVCFCFPINCRRSKIWRSEDD